MVSFEVNVDGIYTAFDAPKGGFKIRYEMENPIFSLDSLGRTHSYKTVLPDTPKNRRLLSHADRIDLETHDQITFTDARLKWAGVVIRSGRISGGDDVYNGSGFPVVFYADEREFLEAVKDVQLKDAVSQQYDEVLHPSAAAGGHLRGLAIQQHLEDFLAADEAYPSAAYCFPCVQDPEFYSYSPPAAGDAFAGSEPNFYKRDFYQGFINHFQNDIDQYRFLSEVPSEQLVVYAGLSGGFDIIELAGTYDPDGHLIDLVGQGSVYNITTTATHRVILAFHGADFVATSGRSTVQLVEFDGAGYDLANMVNIHTLAQYWTAINPNGEFFQSFEQDLDLTAGNELALVVRSFNSSQLTVGTQTRLYIHIPGDVRTGYNICPFLQPYESPTPIIPMFYASEVISRLAQFYGYQSAGAFEADDDLQRLVLFNNKEIYSPADGSISLDWEDYPNSVQLADHVPDVNVDEFLTGLQQFLFGIFIIAEGQMRFHFAKDIIRSHPTADWTARTAPQYQKEVQRLEYKGRLVFGNDEKLADWIPSDQHDGQAVNLSLFNIKTHQEGDVILVTDNNAVFEASEEVVDSIEWFPPGSFLDIYLAYRAPYIDDFDPTGAADEVEVPVAILPVTEEELDYSHPFSRQKGNSVRYDGPDGSAPFTLFYYFGATSHSGGYDYPLATIDHKDPQTEDVLASFNLRRRADSSSVENTKGKEYIDWMACQTTIVRRIIFTPSMLRGIRWDLPKITLDRQHYIIKKLKGNLSNASSAVFEVELVLVPPIY